jgi:hypothetical protein
MNKTPSRLEAFRDQLVSDSVDEPRSQAVLRGALSMLAFTASFALGLSAGMILFQFLVGAFTLRFLEWVISEILPSRKAQSSPKVAALFANRDPLLPMLLQSQADLLSRGSSLPIQGGGLMILGYYLSLELPYRGAIALGLFLGIAYEAARQLESRLSGREKWRRASSVLNAYFQEHALGPNADT